MPEKHFFRIDYIGSVQHQGRRGSCFVKGAVADERTLTRREEAELAVCHYEGGR
jgi:hypothetical protein